MGDSSSGAVNSIEYVTIATTGNSTDFGDLLSTMQVSAGCGDGRRGLFGGNAQNNNNVIQYITISTPGNATDFGDLTAATQAIAGCSGN